MATTFVHIGDFHAAPGPRNADRYQALEQIQAVGENFAAKGELGAWLWPGDLNDARMSIEDWNRLSEVLMDMGRVAPVLVCYGNHDLNGDLDIFGRLNSVWPIIIVDRPRTVRLRLATGEWASIFVLPYPHRAGLVAQGVAPADVVPAAADLLEPVFMVAEHELVAAREAGDLTLMIGHVNVAGAIASTGQPNIGREIELSPKHLERLGNIPKLLNHIHKPQFISGAYYAGSVCRMDYGEIEAKEFITVAHFADAGGEWGIFHHLLDIAPMFHIEGNLTREGFLENGGAHSAMLIDWRGADVRVRYSYLASEKSALDDSCIRELFKDALRLKVEGVAVADRELRNVAVATAKTLPEKLAAYRKEEQLQASVADKLDLLTIEPSAFLVKVAASIAVLEQPERVTVAA